ncbi:MAG: Na/Pi symporter [Proteobacteria bacterium]|nr:Na/Pi symporter [Pseudomonadota bacterium]
MRVLFLLVLLYLFLFSIDLLGSSFKMLGKDIAEGLISATTNPFAGLMIGILTTAIVQSSSLTTSLIVALVSAGGLTVNCAVPIVMGANIGTTITCAIVSLGHIRRNDEFERAYAGANMHDVFNVLSVAILLPLEMATGFLGKAARSLSAFFYGSRGVGFESPLKVVIHPAVKWLQGMIGDLFSCSERANGVFSVVVALVLVFVSLSFIVKLMRRATSSKAEHWIQRVFSANPYIVLAIGTAFTALVQSSSITTSMMVPLVGAGLITLAQAFPLTVGANLGTTVTALLATLAGNQDGLTIAFVHLLFNICGTAIFFVPPFMRRIPISISTFLSHYFVTHKKLVFVYILTMFFLIPFIGMILSEML